MRLAPCKDAFFKKTSCSEPVYLNTLVSDLLGARRTRPPKTGRLPHPELLAREPSFFRLPPYDLRTAPLSHGAEVPPPLPKYALLVPVHFEEFLTDHICPFGVTRFIEVHRIREGGKISGIAARIDHMI